MEDFLKLNIIYEDNHLLVVNKPSGILVQGDITKRITLLELAKKYIKIKYNKKGEVFLAIVHRLDRPVSGVVIFGRNSKSASRLSQFFRERKVEKIYLALCHGILKEKEGVLKDYLTWDDKRRKAKIISEKDNMGKESITYYEVLYEHKGISLIKLLPQTGRKHQLRIQLAKIGHPILGDIKYGGRKINNDIIFLHCYSIKIPHPVKKTEMEFKAILPSFWREIYPEKVLSLF